jgi:hypothetical protein
MKESAEKHTINKLIMEKWIFKFTSTLKFPTLEFVFRRQTIPINLTSSTQVLLLCHFTKDKGVHTTKFHNKTYFQQFVFYLALTIANVFLLAFHKLLKQRYHSLFNWAWTDWQIIFLLPICIIYRPGERG